VRLVSCEVDPGTGRMLTVRNPRWVAVLWLGDWAEEVLPIQEQLCCDARCGSQF